MDSPLGLLLKDAAFLGACVLFLASLSSFIWSVAALQSKAPASSGQEISLSSRNFPPIMPGPAKTDPLPPLSVTTAPLPSKNDPDLIVSMMQDKFSELSKRVSAIEHPSAKAGTPPYFDALLKRVTDIEGEVKSLKSGFTQMAAAQNAINVAEITSKIKGIQKLLDNLTSGTDVSKPS